MTDSAPKALTLQQIEDLREELERQLGRLEKSMMVSEEAVRPVELDQAAVGRLSRMDSLQSQEMAKGLRERESIRLALIQEALRKLEAGSYGVCTSCGDAIAFERLFVFPESATCASCH